MSIKTSKATVKKEARQPQNIITPKKLNAIKFQTYYEQVVSDHYNEGPSMVRQHLAQYSWTEYFKDIKLKKTDKIVDIGTGPGYFIDILVNNKFKNIYGVTYSEKEFEDNKDKPGVTMWCQDMSDLPFEDREIDFVRASDVLQCSVMPYITLLEFNRVLKKGGQVFIEVPLPHQPLKHEYIRNRYSVLGQAQLEALLFRSGFDVEWAKITTVPVKNNESNEEFNDQSLTILGTLKRPIDIK